MKKTDTSPYQLRIILFLLVHLFSAPGCDRVNGFEESFDRAVLASVTTFDVADSTRADSIRVHLAGVIGLTTAFSFDRINVPRTDSLFRIGVWGRWRESSTKIYEPIPVIYDTTLLLQSPRLGRHYFEVFGADSTFLDSTFVY